MAEDVELTQTTAGEDGEEEAPAGAATGASSESGCGKYYSFEVAVTMAMPVAGLAPDTSEPVPARLGGGG